MHIGSAAPQRPETRSGAHVAHSPLPLRSGRAVRHTPDYKRHGVVDLYAALEVATGKVTHRVSETHTATDFLAFMNKLVRTYRAASST